MDWAKALDVPSAIKHCRTDIIGDWHRDPWDWPELEWLGTGDRAVFLHQRLNSKGVRSPARLDVAKENFAVRPAMILDLIDRVVYQALADRVVRKVASDIPPWVYGWRLSRSEKGASLYADMPKEWELYRKRMSELAARNNYALATDIVSYFASVRVELLCEEVCRRANGPIVERLCDQLRGWDRVAGRRGLPQRALASCLLGNAHLKPIDDILAHYGARKFGDVETVDCTRWVDDIFLFGNDPSSLRRAQIEIQEALWERGLNINLAKTELLEEPRLTEEARGLEHSAVDGALAAEKPNFEPLEELLDRLLLRPELASHTSIRFATVRMRKHEHYARLEKLCDAANRMPHASASLARLFRDAGTWRDLGDWYEEYSKSDWGRISWAVAQFGTMFPTDKGNVGPVEEVFVRVLEQRAELPLVSLAAQRLAAWRPDRARLLFRELAKTSAHHLERRVIALAALNAGEEPSWIRTLLSDFEENAFTLAFLEDRKFAQVKPGGDFTGY